MEGLAAVLATRNPGKAREMAAALAGLGVRWCSLADFPTCPPAAEEGETFEANALAKARAAAACTGLPALADDSGLCVDALGGAPGVRSARFAGEGASDEENNRLLLAQLTGLPAERRTATFRCAVAWVVPGPEPRECVRVGVCRGIVLEAPRGTGGFGYDPLFLVPEAGKTFAEMTLAEKEGVSHRGRALAAIRPVVAAWAASSRLRGR